MEGLSLRDVAVAGISSFISIVGAIFIWLLNLRKTKAEIEKLEAEKHKLRMETDNIAHERMLRELDRLAEINDEQFIVIDKQRSGIAELRAQVELCAERERDFIETEKTLRAEIERLSHPVLPLNLAFPIEETLPRTFGDNDDPDDAARD